jgi:hypothetical protein
MTVCASFATAATQLANADQVDFRVLLEPLELLVQKRVGHYHAVNFARKNRVALSQKWGESSFKFLASRGVRKYIGKLAHLTRAS